MTGARWARLLVLIALAAMLGVLLWPPRQPFTLLAAVPVAALWLAGLRPGPKWGGWVAVLMIPYFAGAAMNLLAGPLARAPAALFAAGTVLAFLAGLDWTRRMGFSLRG